MSDRPRQSDILRDPFPVGAPRSVDDHDLVESIPGAAASGAAARGFLRGVAVRDVRPLLDAHWDRCRCERCSYVVALEIPGTTYSLVGLHAGPAHRHIDPDSLWRVLKACEAAGAGALSWLTEKRTGPGVWWDDSEALWIVARVTTCAAEDLAAILLDISTTLPHDPSAAGREARWPRHEIYAAFLIGQHGRGPAVS